MTPSAPEHLPPMPALRGPAPRAWWLLWGPAGLILLALLAFDARLDTYLWCATRWAVGDGQYYQWKTFHTAYGNQPDAPFFMTREPPMNSMFYQKTVWFWYKFKWGGEGWMMFLIIGLIAVFHKRRRWMAGAAFAACAVPGALSWLIRSVDGRYRPTHHDGASTWVIFRGFYDGRDLSFPSGHATLAFANAAVLSYLFPRWRPLFLFLAVCTGVSRVVQTAHFWSDVILGASLGWTLAWITMQRFDRYFREIALQVPSKGDGGIVATEGVTESEAERRC
jgi:membrane-associated phospholipid phosphatase